MQTAEWKAAAEYGRWPKEGRPNTMNRLIATYEWVGSAAGLTHRTPYVFWVMMDVEPHREALFNELYDTEHVPLLLKLPGSVSVARYRTDAPGVPRYLAAYEVERTDLPMSKAWNDTSDIGRWKPEVRPYTYNKRYISIRANRARVGPAVSPALQLGVEWARGVAGIAQGQRGEGDQGQQGRTEERSEHPADA
jgi:hypothetical protein